MTLERSYPYIVAACVLIAGMVGVWALQNRDWLLGIGAIVGAVALAVDSRTARDTSRVASAHTNRRSMLPLMGLWRRA